MESTDSVAYTQIHTRTGGTRMYTHRIQDIHTQYTHTDTGLQSPILAIGTVAHPATENLQSICSDLAKAYRGDGVDHDIESVLVGDVGSYLTLLTPAVYKSELLPMGVAKAIYLALSKPIYGHDRVTVWNGYLEDIGASIDVSEYCIGLGSTLGNGIRYRVVWLINIY